MEDYFIQHGEMIMKLMIPIETFAAIVFVLYIKYFIMFCRAFKGGDKNAEQCLSDSCSFNIFEFLRRNSRQRFQHRPKSKLDFMAYGKMGIDLDDLGISLSNAMAKLAAHDCDCFALQGSVSHRNKNKAPATCHNKQIDRKSKKGEAEKIDGRNGKKMGSHSPESL
jgi:hypothetical protein